MNEPTKNFINFYRMQGNYNILNPSEVSVKYVFTGIPREDIEEKGLTISFFIDIEHDYNFEGYTALELINEIYHIYKDKYYFNSNTKEAETLLRYLESVEEEQKEKRNQYEIEYAKYQIEYWSNKLQELTA